MGFDIDAFADRADYVIFWANVFDWLAGPATEFSAQSPSVQMAEWKAINAADASILSSPGFYELPDGSTIAVNASVPRPASPITPPLSPMLASTIAARPLAPWLLAAALVLLALSLTLARRLT